MSAPVWQSQRQITHAKFMLQNAPVDCDVVFGKPPKTNFGFAGFVYQNPGVVFGDPPESNWWLSPIQWLNFPLSIIVPPLDHAIGVYWNLKPGVTADLYLGQTAPIDGSPGLKIAGQLLSAILQNLPKE